LYVFFNAQIMIQIVTAPVLTHDTSPEDIV